MQTEPVDPLDLSTDDVHRKLAWMVARRIVYVPQQVGAEEQPGEVVAALNLSRADFDVGDATSLSQLNAKARARLDLLLNMASYLTNNKPGRAVAIPDGVAAAEVKIETLVAYTGRVCGYRILLKSLYPVSDTVYMRMVEKCDPDLFKELKKAQKAAPKPRRAARKPAPKKARAPAPAPAPAEPEAEEPVEEEEAALPPAPSLSILDAIVGAARAPKRKRRDYEPGEGEEGEEAPAEEEEVPARPRRKQRPRKRARTEDPLLDMADELSEEEEASEEERERNVGVVRPSDGFGPLVAALEFHQLETAYVKDRYDNMSKKTHLEVFGKAARQWSKEYAYLERRTLTQTLAMLSRHYTEEARTDLKRSDERAFHDGDRLRDRSDNEVRAMLDNLFVAGDAFLYGFGGGYGDVTAAQRRPSSYYLRDGEALKAAEAAAVAPTGPDDAMELDEEYIQFDRVRLLQELKGRAPWLMAPGARAPEQWPRPELVVKVATPYVLRELLEGRPLPFQLSKVPVPSQLARSHETMLAEQADRRLVARAACDVQPHAGRMTDEETTRTIEDLMRVVAGEAEAQVPTLVQEFQRLEHTSKREQIRVAMERVLDDVTRLTRFMQFKEARMLEVLEFRRLQIIRGVYPGLLSKVDEMPTQPDEQRELQQLLREDGELDDDETLAWRSTVGDALASDHVPLFPALGDESTRADADPTLLFKRAISLKGVAGQNGAYHDSVIEAEAQIAMAICNGVEFDRINRVHATSGVPELKAAVAETIDRLGAEAVRTFWTTTAMSPAMQEMRRNLEGLLSMEEPPVLPLAVCVNGSMFHTMMTYVRNTVCATFKVAPATQSLAMTAFFSSLDHARLPAHGSGNLHPNLLIGGRAQVGKSFVLNLMAWLRLAVTNATHISKHAFSSSPNLSFAIMIMHEAMSSLFTDPLDTNGAGKTGSSGDPEKVALFKAMLTEMYLSTMAMSINKETGKRELISIFALATNLFMIAVNWPVALVSKPLLTRFVSIEARPPSRTIPTDDPASQFRPASVESVREMHDVSRQHKKLHGLFLLVSYGLTPIASFAYAHAQVRAEQRRRARRRGVRHWRDADGEGVRAAADGLLDSARGVHAAQEAVH